MYKLFRHPAFETTELTWEKAGGQRGDVQVAEWKKLIIHECERRKEEVERKVRRWITSTFRHFGILKLLYLQTKQERNYFEIIGFDFKSYKINLIHK